MDDVGKGDEDMVTSIDDGSAHVACHVAPVAGRMTVFASVEYPRDEPPTSIEIDGHTWRVDDVGEYRDEQN